MKRLICDFGNHKKLYRDNNNGIAWIEDGTTGCTISVHANIDASGSVRGMKNLGYWRKDDRTARSHGFIYNIDTLVYDDKNELEKLIADRECKCAACLERRGF